MNQRSKCGGDRVYRVAAADGEVREGAARRQLGGEGRGLRGGKAPGRGLIAEDRCQGAAAAAFSAVGSRVSHLGQCPMQLPRAP
eukprot:COSAG06_NODE_27022_length_599_cov_0.222222_1_plen_83_part_01